MMEKLRQTPSQTIGPFFAYGLTAVQYGYGYSSIIDNSLVNEVNQKDIIYITGHVYDGEGKTIHDAMIELSQADVNGNYVRTYVDSLVNESSFEGIGRYGTGTDVKQRFLFKTVKPGSVDGQAPHINVLLFMRGSLHVLYTRIYFNDEVNDNDPLLSSVDPKRRDTLIAKKRLEDGKAVYHFDIHVQGENETVFLDI